MKLLAFVLLFTLGYSQKAPSEEDNIHHPHLEIFKIKQVEELNNEFWKAKSELLIKQKLQKKKNPNYAKNIILFLGDGMSVHTTTATRIYAESEGGRLSFEEFPYFGLSKTYCVNSQVADSACSGTAYLSGVKANIGTVGVNSRVIQKDCEAALDKTTHTESISKWAQTAGKATGFVTTARVTHATPAGIYAHSANRIWENDNDIRNDNCDPNKIEDIAKQLIYNEEAKNLRLILGGGRSEFRDITMNDEEGVTGWRTDKRDLIKEWSKERNAKGNATYVWNREQLMSVNISSTDYLLGLFAPGHCPYNGDIKRNHLEKTQPTLTEMTETAIKFLRKDTDGYFLFVEGARIDMGHHETKARKSLEETEEFSNAIRKARELTSEKDTLIVVTADHSHSITLNGYSKRGSNILGMADTQGDDKLPYTILSYANGPGFRGTYKSNGGGRVDISKKNFNDPELEYMATVPLDSATHGGEDVGVYAVGPQSHLFVGNYEQSYLPLLMAYIGQIGPYLEQS